MRLAPDKNILPEIDTGMQDIIALGFSALHLQSQQC